MASSQLVTLPETVLRCLEERFGPNRAHPDGVLAERLNGQYKPVVVFSPKSEDEIVSALQLASRERWAVSVIGGGTQCETGNVPRTIDLALCTGSMNQVVDYSPADLVVTVQPGLLWSDFQAILGEHSQMLPLDPLVPPNATIGGVVATAANGPLRAMYGTLRDMTIGLRVVYPSGQVVRTGGKVVKNVAGYDMTKLFVGSLGTLGVLSEITFKLRPLPAHRELCLLSGDRHRIQSLQPCLIHSNLVPTRAEVLVGDYEGIPSTAAWTLAVECTENPAASAYQTKQLAAWAHEFGLHMITLRNDDAVQFWEAYRDKSVSQELGVRFTCAPKEIWVVGDWVQRLLPHALTSIGLTTGVGRVHVSGLSLQSAQDVVNEIRGRIEAKGGFAVLERGPVELRRTMDCFGSLRPEIRLMQSIKSTIDPSHIMNPCRFLGGM